MHLNRKNQIAGASMAEVIYAHHILVGGRPAANADLGALLVSLIELHGRARVQEVLGTYDAAKYISGVYGI